jgi:hypothetical protein
MTFYDQGLNLPERNEQSASWYRPGMVSRAACYVYDEYKILCESDSPEDELLASAYEEAWDTLLDAELAILEETFPAAAKEGL